MKRTILLSAFLAVALTAFSQVNNLEIRLGADLWKVGYSASSAQINCGLCPQILERSPETMSVINGLQDSVITERYFRTGPSLSVGASIGWPALRAELQISPSMRRLGQDSVSAGQSYANRNISGFIGINPMAFDRYAGRFYLGYTRRWFMDLTDGGIFLQLSYDNGFEEYVGSMNNMALMVRWQPTIWTSDKQRLGFALRGGARTWLLGNSKPEGPFVTPNGVAKKVKPYPDWFLGFAIKVVPF
ncbi:MAG: hypothetical protein AAF399_16100 [Bacteroidota bacterium]